MRKKVIAGNWKMNMLPNEAIQMINDLEPLVKDTENEVILCVPYIDIFYATLNAQKTNIKIGAQNMYFEEKGAYTGEISAPMLEAVGVKYVIIGHSERREYFQESHEMINKKMKSAIKHNLIPILCVGENKEQRDIGFTEVAITTETERALEGLEPSQVKNVIIAYEPIWAIGTGQTPTSEEANNAIKQIRKKVGELYGQDTADQIRILYGGSMKPSNAKELLEMSDIDGGLIGGASLKTEDFSKIVNYDK